MAKRSTGRTRAVLRYPPHWFTPEDLLTFIELRPFTRRWDELGLTDQDLGCLQTLIMINPKAAPVVEDTGGLRKARCGRRDGGKSAGYRVCYVYFEEYRTVLLVLIYPKSERDNLSAAQKKTIRQLIERIHQRLSDGSYRFGPRKGGDEEK